MICVYTHIFSSLIRFSFFARTRENNITAPERIYQLKDAGLKIMGVGVPAAIIETGDCIPSTAGHSEG
jgi:hypothetical protein